jgi:sarcosine oxidase, subunit beta
MPVVMSELETEPVKPILTPTIRAIGFGARQRPDGRTVVSAGLNATVGHGVSLVDFNGLRYWLPRAMAFRNNIKLHLEARRIVQQVRHRATLSPQLVPQTSPEPTVDRPLVDLSLSPLSQLIPEFGGIGVARYWADVVDLTPDGLPVIDGRAGPEGLTIITGLCGHGLALKPVLGEIAADLSLTGGTTRPIEEFRLERFTSGSVANPEIMI